MRRRWTVVLSGLVAGALTIAAGGPIAAASTSDWVATNDYFISSEEVPGYANGATRAVYRLFDPQGHKIGEWISPPSPSVSVLLPPIPGVYSFEGWLEDASGTELSRRTVTLRFDNAVPPSPAPLAPEGWLPGSKPVVLQLEQPAEPLPISGIAGYELTLEEGGTFSGEGGSISLGILPEGVHRAEVVAVSGAGVRSEKRSVVFAVDATAPAVTLHGLPGDWVAAPVKVTAEARDSLSGMEAAGPAGPFTAIAVDDDSPTIAAGASASAWVRGSGVHVVRSFSRDAAGNVSDGASQTATVKIDEAAPQVEFAAAQDPADPERIEALISDSLSGPSPSQGTIAVRPAGTRARFEPLPTQVEPGRLVARWDSDAYAPGKYEFLATGFDVAGNSTTGGDRAHGGAMVLVNPLKEAVTLRSTLAGSRFKGSLRNSLGAAVAGQLVTITESFAAGSDRRQRTTAVRTSPKGAFALRLKPGPSREVQASFGGSPVLGRASGDPAQLAAATRVRFRASAASAAIGGRPVFFSGRVAAAGARGAVARLPVELQFRYQGADGWSEFRTVETDSRGRFRYAYRFSDDDSRGVRFRFRAYVKGREGWPYGPGSSRPVSVRGR